MINPSYSLLDEPCLRVVTTAGVARTVGLREALVGASNIAGLADADPGVEAASLRLLIAVVHASSYRNLRQGDPPPMRSPYPTEQIAAYLSEHADRFDLFDPQRPFLQAPHAADLKGVTPLSLAAPFLPGADSKAYASRGVPTQDDFMDAADAARYLLAAVAWGNGQATSGALPGSTVTSTPAGVLAGSMSAYPLGRTLAETLLLNITPTSTPGVPVWEVEPGTPPSGLLGHLCWPSRSYLLDPDETGRKVARVHFGAGHRIPDDGVVEPHFIFRAAKAGAEPVYLRGSASRALWRETPVLYGWGDDLGCQQVKLAANVLAARDEDLGSMVIYARDNVGMSVATINTRTIFLMPTQLLNGDPMGVAPLVTGALEKTAKAFTALRTAILSISPGEKGRVAATAAGEFWSEVEPFYFQLLRSCAAIEDPEETPVFVKAYEDAVILCCKTIFQRSAPSLTPGEYGSAIVRLDGVLTRAIFKQAKPKEAKK